MGQEIEASTFRGKRFLPLFVIRVSFQGLGHLLSEVRDKDVIVTLKAQNWCWCRKRQSTLSLPGHFRDGEFQDQGAFKRCREEGWSGVAVMGHN
jgi:hypothetical protein